MTFQTFFFETAFGWFLQALPLALAAGVLTWLCTRRKQMAPGLRCARILLAAYLAGLFGLVFFRDWLNEGWYRLLYHMPTGKPLRYFQMVYPMEIHLHRGLNPEQIGNLLMFMPFGVLWPLAGYARKWPSAALAGFLLSLGIEVLQPIMDRSFSLDDILLNTLGTALASGVLFLIRRCIKPKQE